MPGPGAAARPGPGRLLGTSLPILVRPNAGSGRVGDRWDYPLTPARFAECIPNLVAAGATLIGGCCGTTPAHIAAARAVLDAMGVLWHG